MIRVKFDLNDALDADDRSQTMPSHGRFGTNGQLYCSTSGTRLLMANLDVILKQIRRNDPTESALLFSCLPEKWTQQGGVYPRQQPPKKLLSYLIFSSRADPVYEGFSISHHEVSLSILERSMQNSPKTGGWASGERVVLYSFLSDNPMGINMKRISSERCAGVLLKSSSVEDYTFKLRTRTFFTRMNRNYWCESNVLVFEIILKIGDHRNLKLLFLEFL
jgi:hypothetical protein